MQPLDWNDLRHVLSAARCGTLSAAARRLRVHETTVARRLAAIEAALGARLFDRLDGVLRPTAAGEAAVAHAEKVERALAALHGAIGGADAEIAGTVRLTAVPILVNRLLIPAVPRLLRDAPLLQLELIAEPRDLSLTRREADIALRLARPRGGGSVLARRIGRLDYAAFGPRRGDAGDMPWLSYDESMSGLPQARWVAAAARVPAMQAAVKVNDAEAILQAVRAGLGKSLLPCAIAAREAGLRRLGPAVLSREIWLLVHAELRSLPRIAAVIDWLEQTLRAAGAGLARGHHPAGQASSPSRRRPSGVSAAGGRGSTRS
jgi:DNA-binding transcriptional LysR family regulator